MIFLHYCNCQVFLTFNGISFATNTTRLYPDLFERVCGYKLLLIIANTFRSLGKWVTTIDGDYLRRSKYRISQKKGAKSGVWGRDTQTVCRIYESDVSCSNTIKFESDWERGLAILPILPIFSDRRPRDSMFSLRRVNVGKIRSELVLIDRSTGICWALILPRYGRRWKERR